MLPPSTIHRIELANIQYVYHYWTGSIKSVRVNQAPYYSETQIEKWVATRLNPHVVYRDVMKDFLWICKIDGEIAGIMGVERQEITSFYVMPEYKGRGVATAMIDELINKAHWDKYTYLKATVSISAEHFFRKHGFDGKKELMQLGDVQIPVFRMERPFDAWRNEYMTINTVPAPKRGKGGEK